MCEAELTQSEQAGRELQAEAAAAAPRQLVKEELAALEVQLQQAVGALESAVAEHADEIYQERRAAEEKLASAAQAHGQSLGRAEARVQAEVGRVAELEAGLADTEAELLSISAQHRDVVRGRPLARSPACADFAPIVYSFVGRSEHTSVAACCRCPRCVRTPML
eukprot:COSAG01_NODE_3911_length_5548_cov_3.636998_3_plen_165_part_00